MEEIKRLEENLLLVRRVVGWSAECLGEKIGVTRQTINNIENHRSKLTKTQYIAIRCVLDAEIEQSPNDTQMLKSFLEIFVDNPEKYSDEDKQILLEKANLLAPAILAGTATREAVSKEWVNTLKTMSIVVLGSIVWGWMSKIMKHL